MLKFIPLIALSAGSLCLIDKCLKCSSSSPNICLGCKTSFNLTISGCLYSEDYSNELPPNCEIFTQNRSCFKCNEDYHELNGFCEADCYDDCICFNPFECFSEAKKENKQAYDYEKKCIKGCSKCNNT